MEPAGKTTVLCVEDDALLRIDIAEQLRAQRFRVIEAASADEAMRILTAGQVPIEFVFTDIQLPVSIDGLELARWLKVHRPGIVVAITSGSGSKISAAGAVCAAELIFPKPYSADAVIAALRAARDQPAPPAASSS